MTCIASSGWRSTLSANDSASAFAPDDQGVPDHVVPPARRHEERPDRGSRDDRPRRRCGEQEEEEQATRLRELEQEEGDERPEGDEGRGPDDPDELAAKRPTDTKAIQALEVERPDPCQSEDHGKDPWVCPDGVPPRLPLGDAESKDRYADEDEDRAGEVDRHQRETEQRVVAPDHVSGHPSEDVPR